VARTATSASSETRRRIGCACRCEAELAAARRSCALRRAPARAPSCASPRSRSGAPPLLQAAGDNGGEGFCGLLALDRRDTYSRRRARARRRRLVGAADLGLPAVELVEPAVNSGGCAAANRAPITQYSTGTKASISAWGRRPFERHRLHPPADRPRRTLSQSRARALKPSAGRPRRACWASTRWRSISVGCSSAASTAFLVDLVEGHAVDVGAVAPSTCAMCQAIASPSRSGSGAEEDTDRPSSRLLEVAHDVLLAGQHGVLRPVVLAQPHVLLGRSRIGARRTPRRPVPPQNFLACGLGWAFDDDQVLGHGRIQRPDGPRYSRSGPRVREVGIRRGADPTTVVTRRRPRAAPRARRPAPRRGGRGARQPRVAQQELLEVEQRRSIVAC